MDTPDRYTLKDSIRQGGILSVLEYANLMDEITKEIRKNPKCNINIGNETIPRMLSMDG